MGLASNQGQPNPQGVGAHSDRIRLNRIAADLEQVKFSLRRRADEDRVKAFALEVKGGKNKIRKILRHCRSLRLDRPDLSDHAFGQWIGEKECDPIQ